MRKIGLGIFVLFIGFMAGQAAVVSNWVADASFEKFIRLVVEQ